MPDIAALSLPVLVGLFLAAAAVIGLAGTKLAGIADKLADRTGMGEVIAGALFIGASTSLPGAITSMAVAADGHAQLAIGNAVGGLTAQTAFIAVADLVYRRANLEHAAASVTGLTQGTLLVSLLTLPLLAGSAPEWTYLGVHPVTLILPIGYVFGLRLLGAVKDEPMWTPKQTPETRSEVDEDAEHPETTRRLWTWFGALAAATAVSGWLIGETSVALVAELAISETAFGTLFTAVANSLPELVTAIAAVRIGAVSLAVGNIIGGNAFEVLFLAAADVFYREGSIYHAFTPDNTFTALIAILMTGILLMGMLRRQRAGPAHIGFESVLVLALYAVSAVLLFV